MRKLFTQVPLSSTEKFNHLVAELFQPATIALVGVLGILTLASTI